jgi:hypothetical protein
MVSFLLVIWCSWISCFGFTKPTNAYGIARVELTNLCSRQVWTDVPEAPLRLGGGTHPAPRATQERLLAQGLLDSTASSVIAKLTIVNFASTELAVASKRRCASKRLRNSSPSRPAKCQQNYQVLTFQ